MENLVQKSLIIRKETIFDKIRKNLLKIFYKKEYIMIEKLDILEQQRIPKPKQNEIIIPKEIKLKK